MHFNVKIHYFICIFFLLLQSVNADVAVVDKYSLKEYHIKLYNVSCPNIFRSYTLLYDQTDTSIGFDNKVPLKFNGESFITICDGTDRDIPPFNSGTLQNQIRCTVKGTTTDERYSIQIQSIKLYAQNTYDNPNQSPLSKQGFDFLKNTSEVQPYCENNSGLGSGKICKYEKKENNNYYVFSYSEVGGFEMADGRESSGKDYDYKIPENACGVDSNGDGLLDSSELKECIKTDNSDYICSYDYVPCIDSNEEPFCSENGFLNKKDDVCELKPEKIECPINTFYNSKLKACTKLPQCPNDGFYNAISKKCEFIITGFCPTGFIYNSKGECEKIADCPDGFSLNIPKNRCEKPAGVETPPPGFSYNSQYDVYEKIPVCDSGFSYNLNLKQCLKDATVICPAGTTRNGNICQAQPICPNGSFYNTTTKMCETQIPFQEKYICRLKITNNKEGWAKSEKIFLEKDMPNSFSFSYRQDSHKHGKTTIFFDKFTPSCVVNYNYTYKYEWGSK